MVQRVTPWRLSVSAKRGRIRRGENRAPLSLSFFSLSPLCLRSGSAIFWEMWVKCCLLRSSCCREVPLRVRILVLAFVLCIFSPFFCSLSFRVFVNFPLCTAHFFSFGFVFHRRLEALSVFQTRQFQGNSVSIAEGDFLFFFLWFCLCCVNRLYSEFSKQTCVVSSSS